MTNASNHKWLSNMAAWSGRVFKALAAAAALHGGVLAESITPAISYQGELSYQGQPASGPFDFEFRMYDVESGGSEIANTVLLDDVSVASGVFSVQLDFGLAPYAGDQLWIEVAVREGSDSGGYQVLLPRQKINPAPYALHAEMVAMDAVSGAEIADNSITASDLAAGSVGGSEVADGSVTAADLAAGAVTGLTILDNSVGQDDLGSGSVGTEEIIDGTVQAADLAINAVGAAAIAPGAIGQSEIVTSEVQTRVTGTCGAGTYLTGINEDGSAICQSLPIGFEKNVLTVAFHSSIDVRGDGRPLLAVSGDSGLQIYDCLDEICSAGILRDILAVGQIHHPNIVVGGNEIPIISFGQGGHLKIYECSNVNCTAGFERTLDGSADTGLFSDIALRTDGLPIISYYDGNSGDLKLFDCADINCATGIARTLDATGNVGSWTSIAIRDNGLPIISYLDGDNRNLMVYRCDDSGCSAGSRRTLDSSGTMDQGTSIAVRRGGFRQPGLPIISYRDGSTGRLRIFRCHDVNCETGSWRSPDNGGRYSNIAIRSNGMPIVSYLEAVPGGDILLKVADCLDVNCQVAMPRTILAADFTISMDLAIRPNGLPFLSYSTRFNFLGLFSCGDVNCQN